MKTKSEKEVKTTSDKACNCGNNACNCNACNCGDSCPGKGCNCGCACCK